MGNLGTLHLSNDRVERRDSVGEQQSRGDCCELNHVGDCHHTMKCQRFLMVFLGSSLGNVAVGVEETANQNVVSRSAKRFKQLNRVK
jgi:hypothetical protein